MIDRIFYKTRAKINLKGKWLISALVAVVLMISTGQDVINFRTNNRNFQADPDIGDRMMNQAGQIIPYGGAANFLRENILPAVGIILPLFLIVMALGLAFNAFVLAPLSLGAIQYFRANDLGQEPGDIKELLWAFRSPHYLNIVKTMFTMTLRIILWSLLLIIPGIIKTYEYSMIPYLLCRNPEIPTEEAFAQSRLLTSGKKASLFVLGLSFIGWYILGSIPFGLGTPFVKAYESQTTAGIFNDWIRDTTPQY
ncbi:DUF975 family protein [Proteiniclasticum sp. QWL-01]|nr:DUF975 family protein [Proteiniclasticum sp. QWL-01]WFF72547.1 DUF975 family protein [Proteiniclasticum sp. QWL-01]